MRPKATTKGGARRGYIRGEGCNQTLLFFLSRVFLVYS
jgi:hypothetical protein